MNSRNAKEQEKPEPNTNENLGIDHIDGQHTDSIKSDMNTQLEVLMKAFKYLADRLQHMGSFTVGQ